MELNDICNVITCGVAKRPNYVERGIPFLSSKNVKENNFILDSYNYVSEQDFLALTKNNKPEKGDILYTRVGSFGEAAVINFDFDFAIFVSLTLIKPKPELVDSKFLMYYLNSPKIKHLANQSTSGIGVQNLNVKVVRKFPIKLPTLPEQQHIARLLGEADKLRQLNQQLIQKYEQLTQSLFLEMFGDTVTNPKGWEIKKFKDILEIRNGKNQKKVLNPNGKYPIYGSGGIMNYADEYISEANSVIIGRKGNINKPILVKEKYWHVDTAFGLNPIQEKLDYNYLFFFCVRYNFEQHNKTVTIPSLTKATLLNVKIPIPPLDLQTQFAERVGLIEVQKQQAQEALQKSEDLFNSLLQKVFKP